jgi:hypothetical protein
VSARQTAFRGEAPQGLPSRLPDDERLLWQGVPAWRTVALRVFHIRGLALYFGAILAWCLVSGLMDGTPAGELALLTAKVAGAGLVPIVVLTLYSWGVGRSTIYSITNKRVVFQMGLVLPLTINLPFAKVDSASMRAGKDGIGDICLSLHPGDRLAWFMLWPHARPWRMARSEPALRAIPDAAHVGQLLGRALAASAEQSAPVMAPQDHPGVGAPAPVAA